MNLKERLSTIWGRIDSAITVAAIVAVGYGVLSVVTGGGGLPTVTAPSIPLSLPRTLVVLAVAGAVAVGYAVRTGRLTVPDRLQTAAVGALKYGLLAAVGYAVGAHYLVGVLP